jgi:hypothetical protein
MIMKKALVAAVVTGVLFLSGCTSLQHSYRQANIPEQNLVVMPTLVDVEVDFSKRVTATSPKTEGVDNALSTAYYMAIKNSGADIIIDPVYEVKTSGGMSIATVMGYFGKYTNARKMTDAMSEFNAIDTTSVKNALMIINGFMRPVTQTKVAMTDKQKKKALKAK